MTDARLRLTNIQRFATHDGPGIRTVLFFKGCRLHCPWCANPETWKTERQLFHETSRCVGCGRCAAVCESQAIRIENGKAVINRSRCTDCARCTQVCLEHAMEMTGQDWTIEEILAEVAKDDEYYRASGGGITLSGGELFCQDPLPLLKALKEKGYHVAIETEGQYPLEKLEAALPYIDLVFHDIKHCDAARLKQVTGANFDEIERHLRFLKESGRETVIRIPVIPGFNRDELDAVIDYARHLGFERIQLLPFHPMGKGKWNRLGLRYPFESVKMMDKDELAGWADDAVSIGG